MSRPPITRRQRDILRFFEEYTAAQGISPTLEEIAQHFGLNKVTVFGHIGELERKGILRRSAKGVSRGLQIVQGPDQDARQAPALQVLGTIAAGAPLETLETPEVLPFAELAPPDKDVYVLRVKGDSMIEDAICDGDLVIIERRAHAADGETVVAVLPDEEATLKRLYREPDGGYRLQPANAAMEPIHVEELEIRGVVIGVIRRY
jgi:repressor LexA